MQPNGKRTTDSTTEPTANKQPTSRVTVANAARLLDVSAEAVRMRIKRGTLVSEKVDGTVYVLLDDEPTGPSGNLTQDLTPDPMSDPKPEQPELLEVLNDQVGYLREQLDQEREANRENRRIIAGLVQRVPELPPSSSQKAPDPPESGSEIRPDVDRQGSDARQETGKSRSWWQRVFGKG
jgi:hypothetical protein